jgi:hypothetical protein
MSSKFFLYITFFLLVFFFSEGGQLSVPSLFRDALKIDVRLLQYTQKQVNLDIHLLCTILNPETLNNYILHVQTWRLHPVFENVHLDKPYQMCNLQVSRCVCTLSGSFFANWSENGGSSILHSKDNEKLRPTLSDVQSSIHAHHLRVLLETDQRTIVAAAFCVAKKSITEKAQFLDSCYSRIFHV